MRLYVHVAPSSIHSNPDMELWLALVSSDQGTLIDVQKVQYDEDVQDGIKDLKSSSPTRCTYPLAHPFSSFLPLTTNYCSLEPLKTPAQTLHLAPFTRLENAGKQPFRAGTAFINDQYNQYEKDETHPST